MNNINPPILTDNLIQRATDYVNAGAYRLRGRHSWRIPAIVAEQWHRQGFALLRTNTLARHYGVQRKTMWKTIKGVIDAGFIREVGRTDDGIAMYAPCLERGDEWRAGQMERASDER